MLLAQPEGRSTISFPLSSSCLCDARPATPLLLLRRVLLREPFGHSMTAESAIIDTKSEMLWTWLLAPSSGIISSDGWLPARTMPTPGFEPGPPYVSMLRGKYVIYCADFVLFYYCYNLIIKYYTAPQPKQRRRRRRRRLTPTWRRFSCRQQKRQHIFGDRSSCLHQAIRNVIYIYKNFMYKC